MSEMSKAIDQCMEYSISTAFREIFVDWDMPLTTPNIQKMLRLAAKTYNDHMGTTIKASSVREWMVWNMSLDLYLTRIKFAKKIPLVKKD